MIFKALETSQMRGIELIRPFFLPLEMSKQTHLNNEWVFLLAVIAVTDFFFFLFGGPVYNAGEYLNMKNRYCVYPGDQAWSLPGLNLFCIFPVNSGTTDLTLRIAHIVGQTRYPRILSLTLANCTHLEDSVGLKPYGGDIFLVYCFSCQ